MYMPYYVANVARNYNKSLMRAGALSDQFQTGASECHHFLESGYYLVQPELHLLFLLFACQDEPKNFALRSDTSRIPS
jgi:hypothetical protein